jgi:LuxR family maltose regulon positive regulatory protein
LDSSIGKSAQVMLQSPQTPPIESILTNLINDLTSFHGDFFLFLDDFHAISQTPIHEGIIFLMDNLPSQMHLVISGRSEPPFPLPLLRARRQLLEIKPSDLRFTSDEVAQFLNQLMNLNLSPGDIDAIEDLTEGWAAGIQLAALSLQGIENKTKQLQTFSGSHHYIFDYLAQEVLNNQSEEVQNFLVRTAILDQLNGRLCDSLLGSSLEIEGSTTVYSQSILEYLERANLFIVPLDQERRWYRYHHLFSDFLHAQLGEQMNPAEIREMHSKASTWFLQNDMMFEAIDHAFNSGDYSEAASLINADVTEIFSRSELRTLTDWMKDFPPESLLTEPRLNMIAAWAYLATGQSAAAESHLQIIEDILGSKADGSPESLALPSETRGVLAEISCIRTSNAINQFDLPHALSLSRQTQAYLTDDVQAGLFNIRRDILAVSYFNQAILFELNGEIKGASNSFSKTIALNEKNMHLIPMAISYLAHLQELQGLLHEAEETYQMAMRLTESYQYPLPLSGMADVGLGNLLCERNHLEPAKDYLRKGIDLGLQWSHREVLTSGSIGLARVAMAEGGFDEANALLNNAIEIISKIQVTRQTPLIDAYQALLWVRQGNLKAAADWSGKCGIDPDQPVEFNQEPVAISQVRVWIALQKFAEARQLIEKLIKSNESRLAWGQVIQLLVYDALAANAQGEMEVAKKSIGRALKLAAPENYQRIFLDEGQPMYTILRATAAGLSDVLDERTKLYIAQLLLAFQTDLPRSAQDQFDSSKLVEPLSEREMEVFKLLENGLSNQEIAEQLFISMNTVKAHLKSIYSKLEVSNRVQAIAKGREIGI